MDHVRIPPPVPGGCMDPLATNYDPLAATDNGSCTYPLSRPWVHGPSGSEYDPLAATDNGSCTYPLTGPWVYGPFRNEL
jgi:hypothetical protein